jgi:hypothetical protein
MAARVSSNVQKARHIATLALVNLRAALFRGPTIGVLILNCVPDGISALRAPKGLGNEGISKAW